MLSHMRKRATKQSQLKCDLNEKYGMEYHPLGVSLEHLNGASDVSHQCGTADLYILEARPRTSEL